MSIDLTMKCPELVRRGSCEEFARLVDIVEALSQARDANAILATVRDAARHLLHAAEATLLLREDGRFRHAESSASGGVDSKADLALSVCVGDWVLRHQAPAVIADLDADSRIPHYLHRPARAQSMLMVLIRPAEPIGLIGIYWPERHEANAAEVQLLQVLGEATAGALETVRVYRELEQRVEERTRQLEDEVEQRRQSEAAAEESRRVLAALMEHLPMGIAIVEAPDLRLRMVSRHGLKSAEADGGEVVGTPLDRLLEHWQMRRADGVTPARYEDLPLVRATIKGELIEEEEWVLVCREGRKVPILCSAAPLRDADGQIVGGVAGWQDLSQHKLDELSLRESEERFRATFDQAAVGFALVAPGGYWLRVNRKLCEMFGYTAEELRYRTYLDVTLAEDRAIGEAEYRRLLAGETDRMTIEKRYVRKDESVFWARVTVSCVRGVDGASRYNIAVIEDISERKALEERVRQVAQHDTLTDLPNRALLHEFGTHLLAGARRGRREAALLFIDLDRFKPINDSHGHEVGDAVLQEVARRLTGCARREDVVARIGGDEFVAMLAHVRSETDLIKAATHIVAVLSQPYRIGGRTLELSPSVGVAVFPADGETVEELLRNADTAMYQAKKLGRGQFRFFKPELASQANEALWVEKQLALALEAGEFVLHYQPVHDTLTRAVVAAQPLIRWPAMDSPPGHFLPIAEAAGFGRAIARWVLEEACRQQRQWHERGLPDLRLLIKVSPGLYRERGWAEMFVETIARVGADPRLVCAEIAEIAVAGDPAPPDSVLGPLRAVGCPVALTGCTQLDCVGRLPLDILKVGRGFMREVGRDRASTAAAEAVIALGRSLDLELIAEDVESADAVEFLRARGCPRAQGFYFSRPMPAAEFENIWREAA